MDNNQPLETYLNLHAKANDNTMPATFKRGIINAIYPASGTADVQLVGNHSTILRGIFFSSAVNPSAVRIGDKCRIDMFSEINPNDSVIAYIYGRKMVNSASGIYTINMIVSGSGSNVSIPHTLGQVPTIAAVDCYNEIGLPGGSYPAGAVLTAGVYISNTGPLGALFDANYIYTTLFAGFAAGAHTYTIHWSVSSI